METENAACIICVVAFVNLFYRFLELSGVGVRVSLHRKSYLLTPRMDTEDRVVPLWDLPGINLPTSFFQPVSNPMSKPGVKVAMLTRETSWSVLEITDMQ